MRTLESRPEVVRHVSALFDLIKPFHPKAVAAVVTWKGPFENALLSAFDIVLFESHFDAGIYAETCGKRFSVSPVLRSEPIR